jgi:hypothetical protein
MFSISTSRSFTVRVCRDSTQQQSQALQAAAANLCAFEVQDALAGLVLSAQGGAVWGRQDCSCSVLTGQSKLSTESTRLA